MRLPAFLPFLVAFGVAGGAQAAEPQDPIASLSKSLPDKAEAALEKIDQGGRRMLALRAYLRGARSLEARWSWTAEEIADWEKSRARDQALAAVAAVAQAFEEKNPGFSLHVNTHVRSLDEQIAKWNANRSVGEAAGELTGQFAAWSRANPKAKDGAVRAFLVDWKPEATVMIAAPGLSPHGRAQAFDFQIAKGGSVIAAADTKIIETVWAKEGWAERLKAAVDASGAPFDGPLESPHEPWHYEYRGESPVRAAEDRPPPVPTPRPERDKLADRAHTQRR